jgi:hypothetical protein
MNLPHHRRASLYPLMKNATVKAYSLTDFKESAFSGDGRFVRTGGIRGRFRLFS